MSADAGQLLLDNAVRCNITNMLLGEKVGAHEVLGVLRKERKPLSAYGILHELEPRPSCRVLA
jgi:hypothetical protein